MIVYYFLILMFSTTLQVLVFCFASEKCRLSLSEVSFWEIREIPEYYLLIPILALGFHCF